MKIKRKIRRMPIIAASLVAIGAVAFVASTWKTDDADAYLTGFKAGNIMSDAVMSNKNTMSEAQIQSFLKSKNSCNDTNLNKVNGTKQIVNGNGKIVNGSGTTWNVKDNHFVCMADEDFDGQSAARIIWQAAQDYSINPQVLIVLLQKEQGLITDTYPQSVQYRSATGYGCPDTAACDAKYYGLKHQIRMAASLFRTVLDGGWTNYPVGWNYVLYNPDRACGGTDVYIENRATSALYRYTPYQPNAGALAAGFGTAYCGAYGNRNFYNYFTEWFGGTQDIINNLVDPRYLELKHDADRVSFDGRVSDRLPKGLTRKFTKKINVNNEACYLTEYDAINNNARCIPSKHLEELTLKYEPLAAGELWKQTLSATTKVDLRRGAPVAGSFAPARVIKFYGKVTIVDTVYYVTDYDFKNSIEYGILAQNLTNSVEFEPIKPQYMRINEDTPKYNVGEKTQYGDNYPSGMKRYFDSRVNVDGEWYYRTENDSGLSLALAFPSSKLSSVAFEDFLIPRNLRLNKKAAKYNPFTGEKISDEYPLGMTRKFITKVDINGTAYYRTEADDQLNLDSAFKASDLSEI